MNQHTTTDAVRRSEAIDHLTELFVPLVSLEGRSLLESEDMCLELGHGILAEALARALERYDDELLGRCRSDGLKVHDRRQRTLATKLGDVTFRCRRCRDAAGNTIIPLADALDIPWGARVSPAARELLVDLGTEVSFAKSARFLHRAGGSSVSATCVMGAVRRIGQLCAEEDAQAAAAIYRDGVVPDAEHSVGDLCLESDGTWVRLQNVPEGSPDKVEVKGLVSYAGKVTEGRKVARVKAVHHGCVGTAGQFWMQGVAAIAGRFDLSAVERVHIGCDGESTYKQAASYLPITAECDTHLDPFHVNRAIIGAFPASERKLANSVLGMVIDGDVGSAASIIEAAAASGIANARATDVVRYLRNNADIIYSGGPSLGTMESEQQHVYGSRMDSVPCAWSVEGADAMARLRSRGFSGRELPKLTRDRSVTPKRLRRVNAKEIAYWAERIDAKVPEYVGKGYEPEHSASLVGASAKVRYSAGIDSGMFGIG